MRARQNATLGATLAAVLLLAAGCSLDPYHTGSGGDWNFPDAGDVNNNADAATDGGDGCVESTEVCDGVDNDCNGEIDDVPANSPVVASDIRNCGACDNVCSFPSASATCVAGQCELNICDPNFWDLNGSDTDGCEYQCWQRNNGVEVCNSFDDDCDGDVDEDFDLMTDVINCGQCYRACAFFRGVGSCVAGQCELSSCQGGYVDKDGNPDNGCECLMGVVEGATTCDATNPCTGADVCSDADNDGVSHCGPIPEDLCDGVDNDCDGTVDEDAPAQLGGVECWTHPVGCTADASGIYTCVGECTAGVPTCVGGGVICGFQVPPAAEICDDLDNDCNGVVDEGYDKQNDPANCGTCNNQCAMPNAVPACVAGACVVAGCLPGNWDLNGDPADGCEYACQLTNAGSEATG